MTDPSLSRSEQRAADRRALRTGDRTRRKAIEQAMLACWDDRGADEANWLDTAAHAAPHPESAMFLLFGIAKDLIEDLAAATGESREAILRRAVTPRTHRTT